MKSILLCSYREWSDLICSQIQKKFKTEDVIFSVCNTDSKFSYLISNYKYDLIFFIGWSNIVEESIVKSNTCICLHPSLLPKYRGGSPIQHQIINGETVSGVTLFLMDSGIDTGPIVFQKQFGIEDCDLQEVFEKIVSIGTEGCIKIIEKHIANLSLTPVEQDNSKSSYFKRRKKYMSEIKLEDFSNYTSKELFDKIRSLQNPYPNAFVKCKDNTILYLIKSTYK